MADILFYVSGHGFGHATRIGALIRALRGVGKRSPSVAVRSQAPHWIFRGRAPELSCSAAPIDVGVLQPNGLDLDLPGTLLAHEAFAAGWDEAVEREAGWIRRTGATLVVADIPPLAFAAAARAGVRCWGVANFSWDWIFEAYTQREPRWAAIVARYRAAYATADRLFRLPMYGDLSAFPTIVDVPLLVNRAARTRAQCRAAVKLPTDERRHLVLVSFGGLGRGSLDAVSNGDPGDYVFVGVGARPAGFRGDWIALTGPATLPHEVLICACDAVLGKPGFSTVAEVLAHRRRFLYLSRDDFRENAVLERGLGDHACARSMPRADFESGRWRRHLDALFAQPPQRSEVATDGAEVIAAALLDALG